MSSTPWSEEETAASPEPVASGGGKALRPPIHSRCPEIRAWVDPALYTAVVREASAHGISLAESVRRILEAHYARLATNERELGSLLEQVAADVGDARHEARLMAGLLGSMVEMAFKSLLVRLPAAAHQELEERIRQASEGHEKWTKQLARRLAEGGAEEVLAFVLPDVDPREGGSV